MHERRKQQVQAVRHALLKKPAKASSHSKRKRTPFTLKREGSLILGGTKLTIFKGHPATVLKRPASARVQKHPARA